MPRLGAHMSVAGGLHRAFERIRAVGGEALQIFTRNQRQWQAPPVTASEAALFRQAWQEAGDLPVAAHGSYLVNPASPEATSAARSVEALAAELGRCEALAIPWLVIHPGSHLGSGVEEGVKNCAASLDAAFERSGVTAVAILLETTAGQGSALGASFEELARIMERSRHADRLGVCFDTCHAFAAGYELRTVEAYEATFAELDRRIGLARLQFFHLNDSLQGLGSRVDRHAHIGAGELGLAPFRLLINDRRFADQPMTLETPKGKDLSEDIENLQVLRGLLDRPAAAEPAP